MLSSDSDLLTPIVSRFLRIEAVTWGDAQKGYLVRYTGRLYSEDSEAAYDQLADLLRSHKITPLFRLEDGQHVVVLVESLPPLKPYNRVWNVVMFILTVLSVLFAGALSAYDGPQSAGVGEALLYTLEHWYLGVPYAVSVMAILLAHEFGHYLAGRYHKTDITLPYYIPFPFSPFGTMGAFIQMRGIPKNRRHLLDIGIAGPLAGFLVAVPILIYGLATSPVSVVEPAPAGMANSFEGNSLLYSFLKFAVKGEWLPSAPPSFAGSPLVYHVLHFFTGQPVPLGGRDVTVNGIAWAGWAGLLVTALNLIPAGQLDGGHLLYVLVGRRAARGLPFILILLLLLGLVWSGWWLWAFLIFLFGRIYAEPLDQITPLDGRRKLLALIGLLLFILIFTPIPLMQFTP